MITAKNVYQFSSTLHVLYVEDDDNIRQETATLLESYFERLDLAIDGVDGLDKYNQHAYDLVITDINMPRMNGVRMISHIREINVNQKIIAISAHNESEILISLLIRSGISSFILKPIVHQDLLNVLYPVCRDADTLKTNINLFERLNEHNKTIVALKEAEIALSQLAVCDPLTEVLNRRGMQKYFETLLDNMARTKKQGALIFLDIDNFKPLNDRYGHKTGDELLKSIANKIKSNIRSIDAVARFGGDEFIIIISDLNSDIDEAFNEAKIITAKMSSLLCESYVLKVGNDETIEQAVTLSSGFSLFDCKADCDKVIASADEAMYQRKNKMDS